MADDIRNHGAGQWDGKARTESACTPVMTPEQSRAARALLKWSQVRLAAKCGLDEGTIRNFENKLRILRPTKLAAVVHAFEVAGVVFTAAGPSRTNLSEGESGVIGSNEM
jgi:transcriptional regulator with XRE-family HTH domain